MHSAGETPALPAGSRMERIIELSEGPARLNVRNSLLVIARGEEPEVTVPLAEVAVLVLGNLGRPRFDGHLDSVDGITESR